MTYLLVLPGRSHVVVCQGMREAVATEAIELKKIELLRTRSCLEYRALVEVGGGTDLRCSPGWAWLTIWRAAFEAG